MTDTEIKVLDHGYVRLVEAYGSDERIIEAARMSTGKGFLGWEPGTCPVCDGTGGTPNGLCSGCDGKGKVRGDKHLLRYLWSNKHCYDDATEVLTQRGFVRWGELHSDDKLGQWDRESDSLVYEKPLEIVKRRHVGQMYRVDHGGVDLLVTDNHKMLVKQIVSVPGENRQEWSRDWSLVEASELDHRAMIRYRKHAARTAQEPIDLNSGIRSPIFPTHSDSRALLRLIGFFIGDGHAGGSRKNGIDFHLRKPRKIAFLREVCLEVGWEIAELASDNFVVRAKNISLWFRSQFYDSHGNKIIPSYLLDLNSDDAMALLDGLRASDGSVKRGAWEYSTTSKQVADSVQLLVLHAGGAAHVHCRDEYMYRVTVLSRMTEPVINQGKRNTTWENYDGEVFCAHTRTGALVVRRNGKIVLSGNSTPFEMSGMAIEVQAPMFVFREWHRHRTQSYSELSARYTPMPDVNYIPSVDRLMINSKSNKQASTIKGADELTEQNARRFQNSLKDIYGEAQELYEQALTAGVPKELARVHIPVGRYSRMRAAANLRNWLAFLTLRNHSAAQWEIQQFAKAVHSIASKNFPRTMALFDEVG